MNVILEQRQRATSSKNWQNGPKRVEKVAAVPLSRTSVEPRQKQSLLRGTQIWYKVIWTTTNQSQLRVEIIRYSAYTQGPFLSAHFHACLPSAYANVLYLILVLIPNTSTDVRVLGPKPKVHKYTSRIGHIPLKDDLPEKGGVGLD